ncbi:MAG: DUF3775 domain-containing protein [Alphaproteobacteria bacterium]|nr:DUF3775 domain-containing protein [Alphaproteobacteria bacterium]
MAVEKICDFIERAREFDVKVEVVEPSPGSNASDGDFREVLEDYPDDPVLEELTEFLAGLNVEEKTNLVALAWLGRGDYSKDEWEDALAEARRNQHKSTANYLLGMPLISDYLEEGLSQFGHSCVD